MPHMSSRAQHTRIARLVLVNKSSWGSLERTYESLLYWRLFSRNNDNISIATQHAEQHSKSASLPSQSLTQDFVQLHNRGVGADMMNRLGRLGHVALLEDILIPVARRIGGHGDFGA